MTVIARPLALRSWPRVLWAVVLAGLAVANPLYRFAVSGVEGGHGLFNDYAIYWLASRVLASGGNPYDVAALHDLGDTLGIAFLGPGYVYPLPFAILMLPFSALPFPSSAWLFTALSFLVFAATMVVWLLTLEGPGIRRWQIALGAYTAGCYPAVTGSLYFGQANLLVFGLLGLGLLPLVRAARSVEPGTPRADVLPSDSLRLPHGLLVGVATVVKLVPLVLVVPLALARRWHAAAGLLAAFLGLLLLAALVAPAATPRTSLLADLLAPDAFWTNQSINGFASRLVVAGDRTDPALPGLVDPIVLNWTLTGLLALATLGVLWAARGALMRPSGLALGIALALTASIAGAPKDSLWNHAPALLCIGLLIASTGRLGLGGLNRADWLLLLGWWIAAVVQWQVNDLPQGTLQSIGWAGTLLASSALYGLLALWLLLALRLRRSSAASGDG